MIRPPPRSTLFPYTTLSDLGSSLRAEPVSWQPCAHVGRLPPSRGLRSEEHTSELQSLTNLVCRLLLEKKKQGLAAASLVQILSPSARCVPLPLPSFMPRLTC